MRFKQLKLVVFFLLVLGLTGLQAQESLNASGGDVSESGGSLAYSVGQLVYHSNTATDASVVEGVQQPYEISLVIGLQENPGIKLSVSAYPNPVSDYLILSVDKLESSSLNYQLYDMQGKLLQNEKIISKQTSILMSSLEPSTYYLRVIQENKAVNTFKIVKR